MNDRIVIVGAGQAGGRAAEALRKSGFAGAVTIVGEESHAPYERPPLSKAVLTGEKPHDSTALLPAAFYAENRIELLIGTRVEAITAAAHRVMLSGGRALDYDKLLICTGGRVRPLALAPPGRPGVFYLRTIADSLAFGRALAAAKHLVVIGGGFLGLEAASSAKKLGVGVTLVEIAPQLLFRATSAKIGRLVEDMHRRMGVDVRLGVTVAGLAGDGKLEGVTLSDGTSIAADILLVSIGIIPNTELAAEAGAAIDNGIVVDEHGRSSLADIYAMGDVANHPNPVLGCRLRLESWQNAQNQAIATARGICGEPRPYAEVPWFWSDQYDFNIQMVGMPGRTEDIVLRGDPAGRRYFCFSLEDGIVVGATAFNMGGEMRFARKLIETRAKIDPALLANPAQRLRDLAERAPGAG